MREMGPTRHRDLNEALKDKGQTCRGPNVDSESRLGWECICILCCVQSKSCSSCGVAAISAEVSVEVRGVYVMEAVGSILHLKGETVP